jgi:hypothetical protein
MFVNRGSFFRYGSGLSLFTGIVFAVSYHSSLKIRAFADKGFDLLVIPWLAVPYVVHATVCAVLLGAMLTMSFLMCICPTETLAGNGNSAFEIRRLKILCAAIFLGSAYVTIDILRKAFLDA